MNISPSYKLAKALISIKDKKLMSNFLQDLLTPQEIKTLSERIDIFSMLLKNVPQRQIAEHLECGIATVTRGSRELSYGTGAAKKVFSKLNT